jgi:hypothetical protein
MKSDIGINQRIPISILEMALLATLDSQASSDYFVELAQTEYEGENRIKKALSVDKMPVDAREGLIRTICSFK